MHALIATTQFPTMPALLSSCEPGEAWVWGDYVLTVQVQPKTVAHSMHQLSGVQEAYIQPIGYPCAVTVYYRKDRNPHGPSSRPILVICIEKLNSHADDLMRAKGFSPPDLGPKGRPTMIGLFSSTTRSNLGIYNGQDDISSMRDHLFSIIAERIHPDGDPVQIGAISHIHGHPSTGWPALAKKNSGCVFLFILGLLFAITVFTTYRIA